MKHQPAKPAPQTTFEGLYFCLDTDHRLGGDIACHLGVRVAPHEERWFSGGEHKTRPLVSVRDRDVFVFSSLAGDATLSANDRLCRLLFFAGAVRQASARTISVVVPYLCYSRKDRQTKRRDPVTTRLVAQLVESVGIDRVLTVDVYNLAAFQNAMRCSAENLEAALPLINHVLRGDSEGELVVVSPDIGGVKRADRFARLVGEATGRTVDLAFAAKLRSHGIVTGPNELLGDVEGRTALVVDDVIASGTTMLRVAEMLRRQDAASVHVIATHGAFTDDPAELFGSGVVDRVVVTDTIPQHVHATAIAEGILSVTPLGPFLAEAVARVADGRSVTNLLRADD